MFFNYLGRWVFGCIGFAGAVQFFFFFVWGFIFQGSHRTLSPWKERERGFLPGAAGCLGVRKSKFGVIGA